jgi:YHS domain-containing protein
VIIARHVGLVVLLIVGPVLALQNRPQTAKEALHAFNDLIGSWRATATPAGSREEQQKGFWVETLNWQWQFKGDDAWLKVTFDKSKNYIGGELRYEPDRETFTLTLKTLAKDTVVVTGPLKNKVLTLERQTKDETQRFVFTLLHPNRFLYRYEVRLAGKNLFARQYTVGATKEGVAFAGGDGRPECIVSGGLGSISVTYMGKTYYVCCSGCRDEFRENPEKYIKEHELKKKK